MKSRLYSLISFLIITVIIAGIIFFYDYFEKIVSSIFYFVGILIAIGILLLLLYSLYSITKKWLTVGLSNDEKDIGIIILAIIIYGYIFFAIFNLLISFEEEINSVVFYFLRIVLSTIFIVGVFVLFIEKILNIKNITSKQSLLLISIILISVVVIEYFYGNNIMRWLKDNWYYFLGGFVLISIIAVLLVNKKDSPTLNK